MENTQKALLARTAIECTEWEVLSKKADRKNVTLTHWKRSKEGTSYSMRYKCTFEPVSLLVKRAWVWSNNYYLELKDGRIFRCALKTRCSAKKDRDESKWAKRAYKQSETEIARHLAAILV
jgi:hypothetical protein